MEKFDMAKFLADSGIGVNAEHREQIEYIRLDQIDGDPNNFYQLSDIEDLAANISLCGLQQPVRVREKQEGRCVIVSGHRRRAALELLAKEDPEHWQEIPCIVERDEVSPALQQLRLIYANANTREMTSAEKGEQAAQVEDLLYKLKEEGYEFPGRMRDHVAQAVNVSKSKLARLKVIREKLIPEFMKLWKQNKLPESVAYTLAGQSPDRQRIVWTVQTKAGTNKFECSDYWLSNILKEMDRAEKVCGRKCKLRSSISCDHAPVRVNKAAALKSWESLHCVSCCRDCLYIADCSFSCEYAGDVKKKLRDKRKAEKQEEKEKKLAEARPMKELVSATYSRVAALREERKVSAKDFAKASNGYIGYGMEEDLLKMEKGKSIGENSRMPGGIWPREAQRLIAVADLLGCSIDYLLGRDENVSNSGTNPPVQNVPNSDTGWRTGTPDVVDVYIVLAKYEPDGTYRPDSYMWSGNCWVDHGLRVEDLGVTVDYWMPYPVILKCKAGLSPTGKCGAAACCNSGADCCLDCATPCEGKCKWIKEEKTDATV